MVSQRAVRRNFFRSLRWQSITYLQPPLVQFGVAHIAEVPEQVLNALPSQGSKEISTHCSERPYDYGLARMDEGVRQSKLILLCTFSIGPLVLA